MHRGRIALPVNVGGERPQFDLLRIFDEAGVALAPLLRNLEVLVGVDENVEGANAVEQRQECLTKRKNESF